MKVFGTFLGVKLLGVALITVVLCQMSLVNTAFAASGPGIQVSGVDTVAGNSTFLKAITAFPQQMVNFKVLKPDGTLVTLATRADKQGLAQVEFSDYHTKISGQYQVSASLPDLAINSAHSSVGFAVYAGATSANVSEIILVKGFVKADGQDSASVRVVLKDNYGNLVPGHKIQLISSNAQDKIATSNPVSDTSGQVQFSIRSSERRVSTLTAYDLTGDVILQNRTQVAFSNNLLADSNNLFADAGGDFNTFIPKALAAEIGPFSQYELTNFPLTIGPNQNVTFQLRALDLNNQLVQDYTGTVHFSVEADNASGVTLPQDYQFKAEDLGAHTFSLGLSFSNVGSYKIVASDLNDKLKKGEKIVAVTSATPLSIGNNNSSASKPVLTSPAAGTYGQNLQSVTGTAPAGATVKIYDNNNVIGTVQANTQGKFAFQSSSLTDGNHKFYVTTVDSLTSAVFATSDVVDFQIDTTPPKIDELKLNPNTGIKAGSVINVQIFTEPKLSQAAIIFNSDVVNLTASGQTAGLYEGSIQAPATPGLYAMDIVLVDELQNEVSFKAKANVTVGAADSGTAQITDVTTPVTPSPVATTNSAPAQVSGLISYGSEKRVTLVWEASNDNSLVKKYKVYYGIDPKNLNQSMVTKDASTTWYIPNLVNGNEYFFAVTALDDEAMESENRSEIVGGIPFALEVKNSFNTPTTPLDSGLKPAAYTGSLSPTINESGPEMIFLLLGSGGLASYLKRKKK